MPVACLQWLYLAAWQIIMCANNSMKSEAIMILFMEKVCCVTTSCSYSCANVNSLAELLFIGL